MRTLYVCDSGHHVYRVCVRVGVRVCVCVCVFLEEKSTFHTNCVFISDYIHMHVPTYH